MALSADSYLWEHWKFNADQRLKAFNLYVVFSIFANSLVFTAYEKHAHPLVLVFMGGFVMLLATVFAMVDRRSRKLLHLLKQGLKGLERALPQDCRPFQLDDIHREPWARYTIAFNLLFAMQMFFGLIVTAYGLALLSGWLPAA